MSFSWISTQTWPSVHSVSGRQSRCIQTGWKDRLNWTRNQKLMRSLYFCLQAWNSVKTVAKLHAKTVQMGLVEAQRWCKPQELPFDTLRYGVGMRMTGDNLGVRWVDLARLGLRVGVEPAASAERPPIQKGISGPKYLDRKLPMAWSSSDTSEFELEIWDCRMQTFSSFEKKKVEEKISGFVRLLEFLHQNVPTFWRVLFILLSTPPGVPFAFPQRMCCNMVIGTTRTPPNATKHSSPKPMAIR